MPLFKALELNRLHDDHDDRGKSQYQFADEQVAPTFLHCASCSCYHHWLAVSEDGNDDKISVISAIVCYIFKFERSQMERDHICRIAFY